MSERLEERSGRRDMPRTNGAEEKTVEKEKKIYSSQLLSRERRFSWALLCVPLHRPPLKRLYYLCSKTKSKLIINPRSPKIIELCGPS